MTVTPDQDLRPRPADRRRWARVRWPLLAAAGAAAYTASKIHLAVQGRIGLPGFPPPADAYQRIADVPAAQLGNAALGGVALVMALLLLVPMRGARRVVVQSVNVLCAAMPAAGVVIFGARTLRLTDALGPPPPALLPAVFALAVGGAWAAATVVAILRQPRPSRQPR